MSLRLTQLQQKHLALLQLPSIDVVELCKSAFDYLQNGPNTQRYEVVAQKFGAGDNVDGAAVQHAVEALISILIDVTRIAETKEADLSQTLRQVFPALNDDVRFVLEQFFTSKRSFVEGSIKSANVRAHRLVNLDWRLEVRLASRCLLQQSNIVITMKLYLHTEPKSENRELLEVDSSGRSKEEMEEMLDDERRHRKDMIVQTDVSSLLHIIKSLEDAVTESKTRRIRNIIDAIH